MLPDAALPIAPGRNRGLHALRRFAGTTLAVLALTGSWPSTAVAQSTSQWFHFTRTGSSVARWYFEARTITRNADGVTIWLRYVKEPNSPDSDGSFSTAQQTDIKCAAGAVQVLTYVLYDKDGRFMRTLPQPSPPFTPNPGTVMDSVRRIVCAPGFPGEPGQGGYEPLGDLDVTSHASRFWEREKLRGIDVAPR